jgi:hypothetical protein
VGRVSYIDVVDRLRLGIFENVSAFQCALSCSAADTPIRASRGKVLERNVTYAVAEAELGAVQSKAAKLVVFARFRLGYEHTPRSKGLFIV